MFSYPTYDPNRGRRARLRRRPSDALTLLNADPASRCSPTPTRSATCRARRSRCITTGDRPRDGVIDARHACSPTRREFMPPQTNDPIQNYGGERLRRRPGRGVRPQLQHPVRPDSRSSSAPDADGRRHEEVGRRRDDARSTCRRRRRARFGDVYDFDRATCRCWPSAASARARPDGAAAHGDGRQHGRQRRRDDEAVRRRRRRSTTTAAC